MSPERTIGETIRQAREARGLSQEDVGRETRLSLAILRSLETDQFAELPGDLYTQNALRMLADCLGLDRAELMARYRDGQSPDVGDRTGSGAEGVWREEAVPETRVQGLRLGRRAWLSLMGLVVLALLAWLIASGRLSLPASGEDEAPAEAAEATDRAPAAASQDPEPLPPAPAASASTQAETWTEGPVLAPNSSRGTQLRRGAALVFRVSARGECRLQVNVDGRRHLARALGAGDRWTLRASEYLVLSATDGTSLSLELDGEPYPLPSDLPAGRPLALRIDPRPPVSPDAS